MICWHITYTIHTSIQNFVQKILIVAVKVEAHTFKRDVKILMSANGTLNIVFSVTNSICLAQY